MTESAADRQVLVSVIEEIVDSTGSTEELCASSLRAGDVIASKAVVSYQIDTRARSVDGCVRDDDGGLGGEELLERFVANIDLCPVHSWHADGKEEEIAILSRITDPAEYRDGDHYKAVFRGSGVADVMSIPVGTGDLLARVVICRDGECFTDDEVDTARILQPVLAGCLRQTRVMEQMRSDPLSEEAMRELGLTAREAQIFCRLAAGATSQAVGQELGISVRTVEKHVQNIYARIGARNRSEAISILLGKTGSATMAIAVVAAASIAAL